MNGNTINNDVTMDGRASVLASRYRIIRQLGAGGMGSVWLAEDMKLDNKLFAIKMLPSILVSNKRAYKQLKEEALLAMKLVHPNIVQIRAFEENDNNPFLVMDYIEGQTLDDWLGDRGQESGVREEEVIRLLKPIAEALDYAHSEGVVHRDIKPANIMIRKDGRPFVMDFGIAREIQETMTRMTGKMSSGTLMYMSPEQLNGDSPKPSQDVYSFAAMVYECIKGEPPFCRGNIEHQIENKSPKALPEDIGIGEIVMRGLSKSPKDRPESCVEVLGTASTSIGNKCLSIKTCFWKRKNVRRSLSVLIPMLGLLGSLIIFVNGALPFFSEPDAEKAEYMAPNFISGRDYSDGDCRTFTLPGNVKMEMVYVGPGQFLMGTDIQPHPKYKDDLMPHQVKITKGYWIGKYPITQKQWNALVSALDIKFKYYQRNESYQRNGNDREAPIAEFSSRHPGGNREKNAVKGMDTSDFPMEDISWSDCDILVNALNEHETAPLRWRMPTEAEWEFAARGGNKSRGYLYAGSDDLKSVGWYAENSGDSGLLEDQVTSRRQLKLNNCRVHPVKEKDVGNELGIVGMSGNVWEWCRDAKDNDVPFYEICAAKGVVADPCCISTNEYRVLRGGSYGTPSNGCRITTRFAKSVDSRKELYGFRLCCFEL